MTAELLKGMNMTLHPRNLVLVFSLLVITLAAVRTTAQAPLTQSGNTLERIAAPALSALIYDDGEIDNGWQPTFPNDTEYALRFDTAPSSTLQAFSICLARGSGTPSGGQVLIGVYSATGSGGTPGTLLQGYNTTVTGVTTGGAFHVFDISSAPVAIPSSFYISLLLDSTANSFFLCTDEDGVAGNRPIYLSANSGPWTDFRGAVSAATKTFMMRAVVDTPTTAGCVPDSTTACLLNNRFRATVRFRNGFDNAPADSFALRKPVTGFANPNFETVFFYFNSVDNIEILLKMLDQGNVNGAGQPTIAVLFGSATPLRTEVTITDTLTGVSRTYVSQFGSQQGATDFTAFIK